MKNSLHSPSTTASPIWDRSEWLSVVLLVWAGSSLASVSTLPSAASTTPPAHRRRVVFGGDGMDQSIALLLIYARNGNDRRKSARKRKAFKLLCLTSAARVNPFDLKIMMAWNVNASLCVGKHYQHSFSGALHKLSWNDNATWESGYKHRAKASKTRRYVLRRQSLLGWRKPSLKYQHPSFFSEAQLRVNPSSQ